MSDELRSRTWLGDGGKNGFIARHHLRALGLGTPQLWGKPLIGIAVQPAGAGTAVLHGNLAPGGAVLKISAASPHLLRHEGAGPGLRPHRGLPGDHG